MDGVREKDFSGFAMTGYDVLKIQRMYGCGKSVCKYGNTLFLV